MPTTYTATRNASGKPSGGLKLPQRQPSIAAGSSIPVPSTSTITENISSRKSLLPQRTIVQSRLPGLRKPQTQTLPTRNIITTQTEPAKIAEPIQEQQREQPAVETQPIAVASPEPPPPEPNRPEPEDVKIPTPPPQPVTTTTTNTRPPSRPRTEPRTERIATRSRSPVKRQQNDPKPTATKKPSMPPPARPTRSASLRQPSAPKISGVGETRGHARHRSQVLNSQAITGTNAVLSAPSRERSGTGPTTAVKPRPQFTTYQQHFSPKKEAPRTVAAGDRRNTGKSVGGSELPPETVALQAEFLQLYLLHSSSLQQSAEWKSATERQLRGQYNELAASYRTILDEERCIQEQLNLEALYDWSVESASLADHNHGVSFQEEIQSFSRVTQEVADMTAEGAGRYALAVQVFEHWLDRIEYIQRSRENQDDAGSDAEPQYIDSLGSVWRNEVDELTIKAELCLRELSKMTIFVIDENEFCEKHGNSALVQIARKHRDVVMYMIDELKSMRAVESETVTLEQSWIARAADQVEVDQGMSLRTGIWRTMT